MKRNSKKIILSLFLASALFSGCATEPRRTGVVAADGSIVWDEPNCVATQAMSNALTLAGAYYGGRAAGYECAPRRMATVIVPGQTTGFVYY